MMRKKRKKRKKNKSLTLFPANFFSADFFLSTYPRLILDLS